jgi:hypothetical protein
MTGADAIIRAAHISKSVLRAEPLNTFSLAFVLIFSIVLFFTSSRRMRWNRD